MDIPLVDDVGTSTLPAVTGPRSQTIAPIDLTFDPDPILGAAEAERPAYEGLLAPALATDPSMIDPLSCQMIALSNHMLQQLRLRFPLDAGESIIAALYVRDMLARLWGSWESMIRTQPGIGLGNHGRDPDHTDPGAETA